MNNNAQDLRTQLDVARAAHQEATEATKVAQASFDTEGSEPTLRALQRARERLSATAEHVGRAERLLAASEQQRAVQHRVELEQRREQLQSQLGNVALEVRRRGSLEKELRAFREVASAHQERLDVEAEISQLRTNLFAVETELGLNPVFSHIHSGPGAGEPYRRPVVEGLVGLSASASGLLGRYLRALARGVEEA